tara:strand:- start:436 stop:1434 length:999 start_codon:yes stop_codon:yes gene_type:complete
MKVLGVESSCDETSASVLIDGEIVSNTIYSQKIHNKFGGVVPEFASREHEARIIAVITDALNSANVKLNELDGFAVCYGPGLMGALLVGLNTVKGLSIVSQKKFIGVNHLEGHLYAGFIDNKSVKFPFLNLLVSGGHTQLWQINAIGKYTLLGTTVDDAAGEAFDKGARMLGLGYPGGPEIQREGLKGNRKKFNFPRPIIRSSPLNFSFSGLKTALFYTLKKMNESQIKNNRSDLAASYQEAIIDSLISRIKLAIKKYGITDVVVSGGVAANKRFREKLIQIDKINHHFPPIEYCTDNGAMIALAGYALLKSGNTSQLDLKPIPNLGLHSAD